jgi:uncharacterized protein
MTTPAQPLPLFPLSTVLFPGGKLPLKIFEARYLDLVSQCLRSQQAFGVVCLIEGREAGPTEGTVRFESVGTLARVEQADAPQPGILWVACAGTQRFRLAAAPAQAANGLWSAPVELLPPDPPAALPAALRNTAAALSQAAALLEEQGLDVVAKPWQLEDAGWVANRWAELLPLDLAVKQQLLEMAEPLQRLSLIAVLMRQAGFPADAEWAPADPASATQRH